MPASPVTTPATAHNDNASHHFSPSQFDRMPPTVLVTADRNSGTKAPNTATR